MPVGWGIVGVWAVFWIVRRLTRDLLIAASAGVAFTFLPVVINGAHEAKPHLPGVVLMLLAIMAAIKWIETGKYGFAVACQPSCTAVTGKDGPLFFTYYKYGGFPPIVAVRPGSPAERAGVKVGDRVTKIDGRSILEEDGALRLASVDQRETLRLTVQRDGKDVEYVLKFAR